MDRRQYTEEERAYALALVRASSPARVSRDLGIPRTTLRQWVGQSGARPHPAKTDPALVDAKALEIAETLEDVSKMIGTKVRGALEDVPIETAADVRNLLVAHGIASEKVSFLRGGPSTRTEVQRVSLIAPDALRSPRLSIIEGRKSS